MESSSAISKALNNIKEEIKIEIFDNEDSIDFNYLEIYNRYAASSPEIIMQEDLNAENETIYNKMDDDEFNNETISITSSTTESPAESDSSTDAEIEVKKPECGVCGEIFTNIKDCEIHFNTEHTEDERNKALRKSKRFQCPECFNDFPHKSMFLNHLQTHSDYSATSSGTSDSSASAEKPSTKKECEICGEILTCFKDFAIHFNIEHTQAERNKTMKKKKIYNCPECFKDFPMKSTFLRHVLTHTDYRPHRCETCGQSFKALSHLTSHTQIHTGLKPYKCDKCDMSFRRSNCLKRHIETHSGVKSHKCADCGKSFNRLQSLKRHSLIHLEIKPFNCALCQKSFTRSYQLKEHVLKHEKAAADTYLHKCLHCEKSFDKANALKIHLRQHTDTDAFVCEQCGKSFTNALDLNNHLTVHLDVKSKGTIV